MTTTMTTNVENGGGIPVGPRCRLTEQELQSEEQHFKRILHILRSYERYNRRILSKYWNDFHQLSPQHLKLIVPGYEERLRALEECIQINQRFLNQVVGLHDEKEDGVEEDTTIPSINTITGNDDIATPVEQENLRSVFRQLMREWSSEGIVERQACYGLLLRELDELFPSTTSSSNFRSKIRVLVPGAGLGRLPYEISQQGFETQGNEFSLFMLLPSQLILTGGISADSQTICPFILPFSNTVRATDQLRSVTIPDIPIKPSPAGFSMIAGDFIGVYGETDEAGQWDVVVTCFFLDTATNILRYLEIIYALLRPGGWLINLGPLLYHFEGNHEASLELTVEEIRRAIGILGFTMVKDQVGISCTYDQNVLSMHKTIYDCWFFTAQKRL